MNEMMKGLIGLCGVLVACMAVDLNAQVTSAAAAQIQGGLQLSHDPASWLSTLYFVGECIGMAMAAWWATTFGLRRYLLGIVAFDLVISLLIPPLGHTALVFPLRLFQGLAEGMTIPMLMAIALHVLPPAIRLYGLAVYALTATFFPYLGVSLAAFWLNGLDWRFAFFQVVPMCSLAAVLIWFGIPNGPPDFSRFKEFNWRGCLLIIIGFTSLVIVLTQGDRLDWYHSRAITLLTITAATSLPLLVLNEWFQKVPFLKIQMLLRPNLAFGALGLFLFLLISLGALEVPVAFLGEVHGFLPRESQGLTLLVALLQLIMLPAMALLLDREWVDARVVAFLGLILMCIGLYGNSLLDGSWQASQFVWWQVAQAIGSPMVVMPLLMLATNAVVPDEGPYAAALINTPRALAEITAVWLVEIIQRWRGAYHTNQLTESLGRMVFAPPIGSRSVPSAAEAGELIARQSVILTTADTFLVAGAIAVFMMIVILVLPRRTAPPRIALASQSHS